MSFSRPTELLILTNSVDGTSDILVELLRTRGIATFRLNVDLWSSYLWEISRTDIRFEDPVGNRFLISDNTLALFRKPFIDLVRSENANIEPIVKGQIRGLVQFVAALGRSNSNLRLIEPYADQRLPKLKQLTDADSYFAVPDWRYFNRVAAPNWERAITKPLSDSQLADGNIFFTSRFEQGTLDGNSPWFVQEEIANSQDVTCVFIAGQCWFYKCLGDRAADGVDWRTTINSNTEPNWVRLIGPEWESRSVSVSRLMEKWGLHYGRLDFMLDSASELWFLECNSNGQFGWLDNEQFELHSAFLDAVFDAKNAI